jgi:hypothetical protein
MAAAAESYAQLHRRISREMALHGLRQYAPIYAKLLVAPLRRIYAWAVPSPAVLDALAAAAAGCDGGVCEIGAGTGLWAAALRARGVRVHAYDMAPTPGSGAERLASTNWQHALPVDGGWRSAPSFARVASGDAAAATRAHPRALLLMCWPPCEDDETAPEAVRHMAAAAISAHAGARVALVVDSPWLDQGDDDDGRVPPAPRAHPLQAAGPAALAALHARGFRPASRLALPSWPGAPAQLQVWARAASATQAEAEPARTPDDDGSAQASSGASAELQRAELVERHARELDELLLALILRANGALSRGERLVVARCRRRQGHRLALSERLALALRAMRR